MSSRWGLALLVAILVFPSLAATISADTSPTRIAGTEEIEGEIDASYRQGDYYWVSSIEQTPEGKTRIPSTADRVRVEVDIHRESATSSDRPIELRLCTARCDEGPTALLASAEDETHIELDVPVPETTRLWWTARPVEGWAPATEISVTGQAVFLDEPSSEPSTETTVPRSEPSEGTSSWVRAIAITGIGVTGLAVHARLRRWWPTSLLGLYHRVDDDELLEHPKRREIHDIVTTEPGIHFSELRRRTQLATGNLDHHLHRMVAANLLEERAFSGYRCFFLQGEVSDELREVVNRVRSGTAQELLIAVSEGDKPHVSDLAREASVTRSTVSYHLDRLAEADLVQRETDGPKTRVTITPLGEAVLEELSPSDRS